MNAVRPSPDETVAPPARPSPESVSLANSSRYVLARWISDLPGILIGLVGSLT